RRAPEARSSLPPPRAGLRGRSPRSKGEGMMAEPMGFFTDTTVCIGCKACEVACKEWNQLPAANGGVRPLSGDSYDNTRHLDGIGACPFGVIDINPVSGTAQKCTLCYDRMKVGLEPACAKACPTESINFGTIADLRKMAQARLGQLQHAGESRAYLYGADEGMLGGLNSFYLLVDKPEVYGLPPDP